MTRVVNPKLFLPYRDLIRKIRRIEGGTKHYRAMYARVRGTTEEPLFWDLLRWRAHHERIQTLLDRQNGALYHAARDRDLERFISRTHRP